MDHAAAPLALINYDVTLSRIADIRGWAQFASASSPEKRPPVEQPLQLGGHDAGCHWHLTGNHALAEDVPARPLPRS